MGAPCHSVLCEMGSTAFWVSGKNSGLYEGSEEEEEDDAGHKAPKVT